MNMSFEFKASQSHAAVFNGAKFAVTGVMDTTGREEVESMVLQYGGKVREGLIHYLVLYCIVFSHHFIRCTRIGRSSCQLYPVQRNT